MENVLGKLEFISRKAGKKVPFLAKWKLDPESLTEEDLHIEGDLSLPDFGETILPSGMRIDGTLRVSYDKTTNITPENVTATNISYVYLNNLRVIPEDTFCSEDFTVRDCYELVKLPTKMHISGYYWVDNLTQLETFSQDVKARHLEIGYCPKLRWTGKESIEVDTLYISGPESFKILPVGTKANMIYAASSNLETIPLNPSGYEMVNLLSSKLRELPRGLKVITLDISNTSISSLPEDAQITILKAHNCPNLDLTKIPSSTKIKIIKTEPDED